MQLLPDPCKGYTEQSSRWARQAVKMFIQVSSCQWQKHWRWQKKKNEKAATGRRFRPKRQNGSWFSRWSRSLARTRCHTHSHTRTHILPCCAAQVQIIWQALCNSCRLAKARLCNAGPGEFDWVMQAAAAAAHAAGPAVSWMGELFRSHS